MHFSLLWPKWVYTCNLKMILTKEILLPKCFSHLFSQIKKTMDHQNCFSHLRLRASVYFTYKTGNCFFSYRNENTLCRNKLEKCAYWCLPCLPKTKINSIWVSCLYFERWAALLSFAKIVFFKTINTLTLYITDDVWIALSLQVQVSVLWGQLLGLFLVSLHRRLWAEVISHILYLAVSELIRGNL